MFLENNGYRIIQDSQFAQYSCNILGNTRNIQGTHSSVTTVRSVMANQQNKANTILKKVCSQRLCQQGDGKSGKDAKAHQTQKRGKKKGTRGSANTLIKD